MPIEVPAADRASLSRYLLGQLSAAEEERVEDHFATDDGYFALYQEVERALVCAYASGAMEPSEAALFERNYLVTGERREHVTMVRAMLAVRSEQRGAPGAGTAKLRRFAPALACAGLVIALAVFFWMQRRPSSSRPVIASLPHVQKVAPPSHREPVAPSHPSAPVNAPRLAATKPAQAEPSRVPGKASRHLVAAAVRDAANRTESAGPGGDIHHGLNGLRDEKNAIAANQAPGSMPPVIGPRALTLPDVQPGKIDPRQQAVLENLAASRLPSAPPFDGPAVARTVPKSFAFGPRVFAHGATTSYGPTASNPGPAPNSAPNPKTISRGQTPDQVTAVLGLPDKIVKLGSKEIYIYKDLKITFVNGRVTDAQ